MEKRGIKPKQTQEDAQNDLKRLMSNGHQVKKVRLISLTAFYNIYTSIIYVMFTLFTYYCYDFS